MSNYKYLNFGTDPIKYVNFNTNLKPIPMDKGNTIYIIVKNILQINGAVPASITKMENDIPDFMVSDTGVVQISPLKYISTKKPDLMNPNQNNVPIYNNAIRIYCLATRGRAYSNTNVGSYLIKLLARLYDYYTSVCLFSVKILEYYSSIEFTEFRKKNLIVYKSGDTEYDTGWLRSDYNDEGRHPKSVEPMIGLSLIAETMHNIITTLKIEKSSVKITSTYRSLAHHESIYRQKGQTPVMSSKHLYGRAVDFTVEGESQNSIVTRMHDSNIRVHKYIREVSSGNLDDIFERDLGWIHLEVYPPDTGGYIEDPGYFTNNIIRKDILSKNSLNYKMAKDAEVLSDFADGKNYDLSNVISEINSNSNITKVKKERIQVLALALQGKKFVDFYSRRKNFLESPAVSNIKNMAKVLEHTSFNEMIASKIKYLSYEHFKCRYVYNYVEDEWEILDEV